MKRTLAIHALVAGLLLLASAAVVFADNWPQWRGPTNDGISTEKNISTKWSATDNIAWKLEMPGMAGSTPIVWGDRIFLTSADKGELVLLCVSTDGKQLWKKQVGTTWNGRKNGNESNTTCGASPCTDGQHVFAFAGNSGELMCFDFDGKEIWKADLQARYGKFSMGWGMHTSPLLDGDRLYMQLLSRNFGVVHCLEQSRRQGDLEGQTRKPTPRGESKESYATPAIWRQEDGRVPCRAWRRLCHGASPQGRQ